jgi:tetratricopeptide (TPR) repeat protein
LRISTNILVVALLGLWVCLGSDVLGQGGVVHSPAFETKAYKGLDLVYNCQFQAAEAVFIELRSAYPNHPGPTFLLAVNRWWQLSLNTQQRSLDAGLLLQIDRTVALSEAILKQKPDNWEAEFLQFAAWGFKSRLQAVRGEFVSAGRTALKCLPGIKKGNASKAQHPEFLFGSGLYLYYRAWYSDAKPALRPVMALFPPGDKKLGLAELTQSADSPNYTSVESEMFLTELLLLSERNYPRALKYATRLHQRYPLNSYFELYHNGQYATASQLFARMVTSYNTVAKKVGARAVNQLDSRYTTQLMQTACLYYALCLQHEKADYTLAASFLSAASGFCAINGESDTELRAQIRYQLGNCYDRTGQRSEAIKQYNLVVEQAEAGDYKRLSKAGIATPVTAYNELK